MSEIFTPLYQALLFFTTNLLGLQLIGWKPSNLQLSKPTKKHKKRPALLKKNLLVHYKSVCITIVILFQRPKWILEVYNFTFKLSKKSRTAYEN